MGVAPSTRSPLAPQDVVLALVRYTMGPDKGKKGGHFIVFDAWRDLLIIGPCA